MTPRAPAIRLVTFGIGDLIPVDEALSQATRCHVMVRGNSSMLSAS